MGFWNTVGDFTFTRDKGLFGTGLGGRGGVFGTGLLGYGERDTDKPLDASAFQQDRDDSRAMMEQFLRERGQSLPAPPQVQEAQSTPAREVQVESTGPIERVSAQNVGAAPQVSSGFIAPAQRVEAERVQAPNLGPAQQASWERFDGATIDQQQATAARGHEAGFLSALEARAQGQGPSVAVAEHAKNIQGIADEQLSLAASAKGNEGAFARRQAARDIAKLKNDSAATAAVARAHEVGQATEQGARLASQMRAGDAALATEQARLRQGAGLANQATGAATSQFNAGQMNQTEIERARQALTASTGNADRSLAAGTTNVTLDQQRNLAQAAQDTIVATGNADRTLTANTTNAMLGQQADTVNAGAANTRQDRDQALRVQAAIGNADRIAQVNDANANRQQRAQVANQGAAVTTTGQQIQRDIALGDQAHGARQGAGQAAAQAHGAASAERQFKAQKDAALLSAAGTVGAAVAGPGSDERAKKNIRPSTEEEDDAFLAALDRATGASGKDADAFTRALESHVYDYREPDPHDGATEGAGPMAQELEKAGPLGRQAVRRGDDGMLKVDTDRLTLALAAVTARKLRELEGRR
jgi:hypothetical protein